MDVQFDALARLDVPADYGRISGLGDDDSRRFDLTGLEECR
jgi:hypothetical protein